MKVFCSVGVGLEGTKIGRVIHIVLDVPIPPLVGMSVALPYPKEWDDICGGLIGTITGIVVIGQLVAVDIKISDELNEEALSELISIGYDLEEFSEISEEWNTLGRT